MSVKWSQRASSKEQIDAETTEDVPGDHRDASGTWMSNHLQLLFQEEEQVGRGSGETEDQDDQGYGAGRGAYKPWVHQGNWTRTRLQGLHLLPHEDTEGKWLL